MCVVFEDYQWESSPHQPLTKITVTSPSQEEFDEEKIDFLKKVAKLVGVNLEEIFKN